MSLPLVASRGEAVQSAPRTILVVDHRETIRRVLALILEAEGYEVVTTDAASAAVALVFELQPAAVILDVSLTEHSALSALRLLRADKRTQSLPVVLLDSCTAALTNADLALVQAVLTKPLDLDALVLHMAGLVGPPVAVA
ncbi:MAG TPA: response regulator [Chloroflexota bacterium]|nr:response regulator [Chloroflexota bacterium]